MNSGDRRCHALINLDFGDGRLNMSFDPMKRRWNMEDNIDNSDNSSENESEVTPSLGLGSIDVTKLNALKEKQNDMTRQLIMLKDSK